MTSKRNMPIADHEWLALLNRIVTRGEKINPRGKETLEVLNGGSAMNASGTTIRVPMTKPVITNKMRRLNYSFMAAEALWICSGDSRVDTIAPYNPNIAKFSDDGVSFNGAYGPPVVEQLPYVVETLARDNSSRQAVINIWKPSPSQSKDIPCTIALVFNVRPIHNRKEPKEGELPVDHLMHTHVFMRSSDAWLGVPYDIFNFSMISAMVACTLNASAPELHAGLGLLTLTAVSSHLYTENLDGAKKCAQAAVDDYDSTIGDPPWMPQQLIVNGRWSDVRQALVDCRDKVAVSRVPWHVRPWPLKEKA